MSYITGTANSDWVALLAAARQGDDVALGQVWSQLRSYLLLVADRGLSSGLRGKLDASDIVQQSLLEAQQDFASFAGSSEPELRAWLVKLVQHNLIDASRRYRQTERRDLSREVSIDVTNKQHEIASPQEPPSGLFRRRETDEQLLQAVARLPERRRQLLELRHRRGFSYAQIGLELGMTEAAARQLWSRTLNELRTMLTNDYADQPTQPR